MVAPQWMLWSALGLWLADADGVRDVLQLQEIVTLLWLLFNRSCTIAIKSVTVRLPSAAGCVRARRESNAKRGLSSSFSRRERADVGGEGRRGRRDRALESLTSTACTALHTATCADIPHRPS